MSEGGLSHWKMRATPPLRLLQHSAQLVDFLRSPPDLLPVEYHFLLQWIYDVLFIFFNMLDLSAQNCYFFLNFEYFQLLMSV